MGKEKHKLTKENTKHVTEANNQPRLIIIELSYCPFLLHSASTHAIVINELTAAEGEDEKEQNGDTEEKGRGSLELYTLTHAGRRWEHIHVGVQVKYTIKVSQAMCK